MVQSCRERVHFMIDRRRPDGPGSDTDTTRNTKLLESHVCRGAAADDVFWMEWSVRYRRGQKRVWGIDRGGATPQGHHVRGRLARLHHLRGGA